jgi:hypothetical protein
MDQARAEQAARALAPMRDRAAAAAQAAIPYPVRLLDLLGIGVPGARDILALWSGKRAGPTTRVVLGADASGPVTVDLAAQGPHTVVGGAAGAGKSVLLRTLVTALVLTNRPDELNLVLIDGKGDGTFLPFGHCPHVAALIGSAGETAADAFGQAGAARVLASVRGEMSRRKAILSRHGGDIDSYWRARELQPALPPAAQAGAGPRRVRRRARRRAGLFAGTGGRRDRRRLAGRAPGARLPVAAAGAGTRADERYRAADQPAAGRGRGQHRGARHPRRDHDSLVAARPRDHRVHAGRAPRAAPVPVRLPG